MFKLNDSKFIALMAIVVCFLISSRLNINLIIIIILFFLGVIVAIFAKPNKYPVRLVYAQIIYNVIIKFAISYFHIPNSANYITDIFTLLIVKEALVQLNNRKSKVNIGLPTFIILAIFLVTICGFIVNNQSVFLYSWGFRNNFRFFGFFFGCVVLLKKKDIDNIFKILIFIFKINILVITAQYFIFGLKQDNLGGVFGTVSGVNAHINIFICIVSTIALVQFLFKKISSSLMIGIIISSIYIAALSELKVFFVELIIIMACIFIMSKPSKKMLLLLFSCVISLYIGIQVMYSIFPYFKDFFNIETMIASSSTYSTPTDLGRLTATNTVTTMFLSDDKLKYLFGLGLGSAETSQITMFSSSFFYQYGDLLHYSWFSSAFMLIENGWLGLTLYLLFFISITFSSFKIRKNSKGNLDYCIIAQVFSVLCCIMVYYNSSLRTEAGYFAYFILSIPFIIKNDCTKEEKSKIMI